MAFKLRDTLVALKTHLQGSERFDDVTIGEPLSAPSGVHCAVLLSGNEMSALTLSGTIEQRTVTIRVYVSALSEPKEETEFLLDDIQAEVVEDVCGDFDLGATGIRSIEPIGITVRYGYQTIGGGGNNALFRIMDINLPMTVDDSAVLTQ